MPIFRRKEVVTHCSPPGMLHSDPPAKKAYDWGRLDRRTDQPPQPEEHSGHESDYLAGYNRRLRRKRHRRPKSPPGGIDFSPGG